MGGQRHSKNAGVMGSESMTYHERKALGYGTVRERIGKESLGNYYDCRLTLQPAVEPVCCPDGFIFSKEAIYEYILQQKKEKRKQLEVWKAEQERLQQQEAEKAAVKQQAELLAFDRANHMGASHNTAATIKTEIDAAADRMHDTSVAATSVVSIQEHKDRIKELKAFWVPSKTPAAAQTQEKPKLDVINPASGKKLRAQDLTELRFTRADEDDSGLHMDPVTRETFTNASKLVALKTTGAVMLESTYNKCIKADGHYQGVVIREKDVIKLQGSGTGFAARDKDKLRAEKQWLLGPGNGMTDLRGQHKGPRSHGGLQFWN